MGFLVASILRQQTCRKRLAGIWHSLLISRRITHACTTSRNRSLLLASTGIPVPVAVAVQATECLPSYGLMVREIVMRGAHELIEGSEWV